MCRGTCEVVRAARVYVRVRMRDVSLHVATSLPLWEGGSGKLISTHEFLQSEKLYKHTSTDTDMYMRVKHARGAMFAITYVSNGQPRAISIMHDTIQCG